MSKETPQQQPQSEEVDLGQLFKLIGNVFDKLFAFIGGLFKSVFSIIIYTLKAFVSNYKIIVITMIIAAAIGYGLEKTKPKLYESSMLVKPYFESKFQLVTNIGYYNALIADQDYKQLGSLFDISEEEAMSLIGFEIHPGPETENSRIQQYDRFVRSIDSVRAQDISYDEFIEQRSIYTGDLFEIGAISKKKDIFRSLESGLNSTFSNTYSVKKMQRRDSIISLSKARIRSDLKQVDSLKRMYIAVMKESAGSNNNGPLSYKDGGMALVQERVETKEYELLAQELALRKELTQLESEQIEEDVYFDTLSSFQDVGSVYTSFFDKYSILFPAIAFILLCLGYLCIKGIRFISAYEK